MGSDLHFYMYMYIGQSFQQLLNGSGLLKWGGGGATKTDMKKFNIKEDQIIRSRCYFGCYLVYILSMSDYVFQFSTRSICDRQCDHCDTKCVADEKRDLLRRYGICIIS